MDYKLMSERLNRIGEQVTAAGLEFAYHNHGFEFEGHQGETGFDILLKETDPERVKLQLDFYWVVRSSKRSPKELIEDQPGRYVMWHIKDMDKATRDYTELGNGSINYAEILPDPVKSGLEFYYIEQGGNYSDSPMKSAATSADFLPGVCGISCDCQSRRSSSPPIQERIMASFPCALGFLVDKTSTKSHQHQGVGWCDFGVSCRFGEWKACLCKRITC